MSKESIKSSSKYCSLILTYEVILFGLPLGRGIICIFRLWKRFTIFLKSSFVIEPTGKNG